LAHNPTVRLCSRDAAMRLFGGDIKKALILGLTVFLMLACSP